MDHLYRQNFIAVFLGDDRAARKRARSLNLRYGICSVILDKKPSIISHLSPCIKARGIGDGQCDDILLAELFSVSCEPYRTYLLFASEQFEGFVRRNASSLERCFIMKPEAVISSL